MCTGTLAQYEQTVREGVCGPAVRAAVAARAVELWGGALLHSFPLSAATRAVLSLTPLRNYPSRVLAVEPKWNELPGQG